MRGKRVDANQESIVSALRKAGCKVYVSSSFGEGFPDLIVGRRAEMQGMGGSGVPAAILLLEVKDGDKPPSARKLTKPQEAFFKEWEGLPVYVVESPEQALDIVSGRG